LRHYACSTLLEEGVSPVQPPGELPDQLLDRLEVESEGRDETLCGGPAFANVT